MAAFKENSKEKNLFYLFNKKVLTTIKQTISRMKFLESLQPFKLYIKGSWGGISSIHNGPSIFIHVRFACHNGCILRPVRPIALKKKLVTSIRNVLHLCGALIDQPFCRQPSKAHFYNFMTNMCYCVKSAQLPFSPSSFNVCNNSSELTHGIHFFYNFD